MNSIKNTDFQITMDNFELGKAQIKVIGVGGGGNNAINTMIRSGMKSVGFIAANTDTQALDRNLADTKLTIGGSSNNGLGAGANPKKGLAAAEESIEELKEVLAHTDMLFITAGMGGGTGTGAAPVIAKTAREMGILTVGIITTPFSWEARRRMKIARFGVKNLSQHVDSLIVIPNNKLLDRIDTEMRFEEAFSMVDEVLVNATRGITDIIMEHSFVNVDFADVEAIIRHSGKAMMGIGTATGDNRATEAAVNALNSPFLDNVSVEGASGILVKISAGELKMSEINEAMSKIREVAGYEVDLDFDFDDDSSLDFDDFDEMDGENVIFGASENLDLGDKLQVTLIATGLTDKKPEVRKQGMLTENRTKSEDVENSTERQDAENTKMTESSKHQEKELIKEPVYDESEREEYVSAPSNPFKKIVNMQNLSVPRGTDALAGYDTPANQRRNGGIRRGMLSNN